MFLWYCCFDICFLCLISFSSTLFLFYWLLLCSTILLANYFYSLVDFLISYFFCVVITMSKTYHCLLQISTYLIPVSYINFFPIHLHFPSHLYTIIVICNTFMGTYYIYVYYILQNKSVIIFTVFSTLHFFQ